MYVVASIVLEWVHMSPFVLGAWSSCSAGWWWLRRGYLAKCQDDLHALIGLCCCSSSQTRLSFGLHWLNRLGESGKLLLLMYFDGKNSMSRWFVNWFFHPSLKEKKGLGQANCLNDIEDWCICSRNLFYVYYNKERLKAKEDICFQSFFLAVDV